VGRQPAKGVPLDGKSTLICSPAAGRMSAPVAGSIRGATGSVAPEGSHCTSLGVGWTARTEPSQFVRVIGPSSVWALQTTLPPVQLDESFNDDTGVARKWESVPGMA
jgi:hypothetical protein